MRRLCSIRFCSTVTQPFKKKSLKHFGKIIVLQQSELWSAAKKCFFKCCQKLLKHSSFQPTRVAEKLSKAEYHNLHWRHVLHTRGMFLSRKMQN
jgi:hypothetical protein